MSDPHSYLDVLARVLALPLSEGLVSSDERFHAASAGADTLIVDVEQRRYHRVFDARPLRFEDTVHDGVAQASLQIEHSDGVRTIALAAQDDSFWTPLPDPRVIGLPRIVQRHDTSWTSPAPPPSDAPQRTSITDWLGSLVALAVLAFFAAFGFDALRWSLEGGWNLLWLLVGLPVFPIFTVMTLAGAYGFFRTSAPPRQALNAIDVGRDERFRIGEPLAFRVDATVPASVGDQPAEPPPQIFARLVVQRVNDKEDGSWWVGNLGWDADPADCVPSTLTGTGEPHVHYASTVTVSRNTPRAAQERWFLTLSASQEPGTEPFHVTSLATPPSITPYRIVQQPDRLTQLDALLDSEVWALVRTAYNGEDGTTSFDDFTPEEYRAVFTVDIEALVDHAMATRWYEGQIKTARVGGDSTLYLLKEGPAYKVMFTERWWTESLYESTDLRSAVARYLVANQFCVRRLPGAQALEIPAPYSDMRPDSAPSVSATDETPPQPSNSDASSRQ
ncbi:hypothetical protein [Variovorax sp. EBFNA2]|uniref:hypothetical protein n=1 Tax=Variovorax sp. EBFNA2 TaxID=3342097 RepID=UPI0029BFC1F8|nr:hypothetical protein [Variovorax boronicumulans]WPG39243.1 hypothetical protein RZE79_07890 [Variovorax boronicumulans]